MSIDVSSIIVSIGVIIDVSSRFRRMIINKPKWNCQEQRVNNGNSNNNTQMEINQYYSVRF